MFHVGTLYGCQQLLELIEDNLDNPFTGKEFMDAYGRKYGTSPTEKALDISKIGGWINSDLSKLTDNGKVELKLTKKGKYLCSLKTPFEKLRIQIKELIVIDKPNWFNLFRYGRSEVVNWLGKDNKNVVQCLETARLLENTDDATIEWWDELDALSRGIKNDSQKETGRIAEKKSLTREQERTGKEAVWEAIESNKSGFDIKSKISKENNSALFIEVKGTSFDEANDFAYIYISRNEWHTANCPTEYRFHIWTGLNTKYEKLHVLKPIDLAKHIPAEKGKGKWESVKIPIKELIQND